MKKKKLKKVTQKELKKMMGGVSIDDKAGCRIAGGLACHGPDPVRDVELRSKKK